MVHLYVWDNGHGLTIHVNFMVKCMYYMSLGSNACFVIGTFLMDGHYRIDIISGVGHSRSDLVVSLMLCTIAYNIQGIEVALQVHQDSVNPAENE